MGICISHGREASHHVQRSLIQQALFWYRVAIQLFFPQIRTTDTHHMVDEYVFVLGSD